MTEETVKKYHLGYDSWQQRIVIPYSSNLSYYCARSTVLTHEDNLFILKPKTEDAGDEPIFAKTQLYIKHGAVFVVESQICALSIMQCGYAAVATNGTSGISNLIKELKNKMPTTTLILSFDNDKSGRAAQQKLASELLELNIQFDTHNISGNKKDPNELLQADPSMLANNLRAAVIATKEKFRTEQDSISFAELCRKKLPPLKWAIHKLFPEGLHLLASMPKVGKSWMALGMCFAVANGEDYLGYKTSRMASMYYALEDNYNSAQDRMFDYAKGNPIPENAYLILDTERTDTGFFTKLKNELEEHPDIGFVVVDTLQNIRGAEIKKGDVYANDVAELKKIKRFAIENHLAIVLVHHLRKAKGDSDSFNNILGSNGIWGTVDTGITLSKNVEKEKEVKMSIQGRGIKPSDTIITLDEASCHWRIIAAPEQQTEMIRKSEYEGDPAVKTIKWLISNSPYYWEGTPTELMMAAYDMDGISHAITQESVGKSISKHKMDLYYDGITTEDKRSSQKRTYCFCKKGLMPRQQSFDADNDK